MFFKKNYQWNLILFLSNLFSLNNLDKNFLINWLDKDNMPSRKIYFSGK